MVFNGVVSVTIRKLYNSRHPSTKLAAGIEVLPMPAIGGIRRLEKEVNNAYDYFRLDLRKPGSVCDDVPHGVTVTLGNFVPVRSVSEVSVELMLW